MPLIIITGTPCSGKTYRAQQLLSDFQSRLDSSSTRSVVYIPSHHASLDPETQTDTSQSVPEPHQNPRDVIYDSAKLEKTARAEEFSAIKRAVSKNAIVIADAPNYIKGFRYQLFCEAKAAGTRSIVVHAAAREEECAVWNDARLDAWGWPTEEKDVTSSSPATLTQGPKIGRDVMGDLNPESHTAIYGDIVVNGSRSRSSSVGANVSDNDGGIADEHTRKQRDDTMTLKSLYISDRPELSSKSDSASTVAELAGNKTTTTDSSANPRPLPPSTPPDPKSSLPYSPSILKSLFMRYEPPSPFTRWDTPLFTVPSSDAHPPYEEIWNAIFPTQAKPTSKKSMLHARHEQERVQKAQQAAAQAEPQATGSTLSQHAPGPVEVPVKQHAATILPSATGPNALQTLESTTGELTKSILAASRAASDGDETAGATLTVEISIDGATGESLTLEIEKPEGVVLSQPKLQRLRRKFTQMQRGGIAHGQGYTAGKRNVAVGFVRFLEGEWASEVGE